MKLSKATLDVLQNFASINQSIHFFKGDVLRVRNVQNTVVAKAKIAESFDKAFPIYDTNALLRVFGLFDNGEISLGEKSLTVSEGDTEVRYVYAAPDTVTPPKEKDFAFPSDSWKASFKLPEKLLANILNAAATMKLTDICIDQDGIKVKDLKNGSSDQFKTALKYDTSESETAVPKKFEIMLKPESLPLLPGDYTVTLCEKKIVEFKHNTKEVVYWIAASISGE